MREVSSTDLLIGIKEMFVAALIFVLSRRTENAA
jgi:hypothetical protein